jgi:multidrug resistance efflux pump
MVYSDKKLSSLCCVFVNETQVASLKTGSPVTVSASVFPDKVFTGKSFSSPQKQTKGLLELKSQTDNNLKAGKTLDLNKPKN